MKHNDDYFLIGRLRLGSIFGESILGESILGESILGNLDGSKGTEGLTIEPRRKVARRPRINADGSINSDIYGDNDPDIIVVNDPDVE